MGSVLNPQVAQELAQEEAQDKGLEKQLGVMALQQKIQEKSPAYQLQLEALKNEKLFRDAASSAGDDQAKIAAAAMKYGKQDLAVSIFNQAENRAARLQQALLENQRHERELEARLADRSLDRESRERLAVQADETKRMLGNLQAETARSNNELRRLQLHMMGQGQLDKKVTAFANELQQNKIPALSASITTANDLLKNYENTDIPGLGLFVGSKKYPDALRTKEANDVRSTLQSVSNDLLNLYSGLAVTLPEAERRELEEMKNGQFTSADFKNAWPRIVNRYNTVVGNLSAGAGPDVLKEYQSRSGAMKLSPLESAFGKKGGGWKIEEVK